MQLTGGPLDFVAVFIAGVLVSFTPCVYPVMPLTAGCIAAVNVGGSRLKGFLLSLIFVLGLAVTYCCLAVVAALTGGVFGQLQNQPIMYGLIAVVFFVFSLIMFDVIPLPLFHSGFQPKVRPRNAWAVFLFGVTSGLVVGPCTAPVLGTLLVYIGSQRNIVHGISLMFFFSYGVGFSLMLVGTFSGMLSLLPKSGRWMVWLKRGCAALILGAAGIFALKALGRM
ncbi:MAG TPA: cytochrome c biogenesis protein CcdA [Candidatus Bathyarchaeia archaeon]|nr:cytochrome c biogenesis protein CcdA [Candidatus Bathyarchaeia archaeon]